MLDVHGLLDEARDAFAVAVDVEPGGPLQRYNLGAVLERLGEEPEAEDCYREAIRVGQSSGAMVEPHAALGALLRRQGRLSEAEQIYDDCLQDDPLNVEMLVEHGICLSDLEQFEPAVERFDVALSFEPRHGGALYNKAITQYRMAHYADALRTMELAQRAEPGNPLTLAVLGAWLMAERDYDLDEVLGHLYRGLDNLVAMHMRGDLNPGYASLVVEEIFDTLWQNERTGEAREVARVAGQRDWITPHMLDTINRADFGVTAQGQTFQVTARAETEIADSSRPEYWPSDAFGYTTALTVVADDEDQARELTLAYLRTLEPAASFDVRVRSAPQEGSFDGVDPARGVTRVDAVKAFFAVAKPD